MTFTIKITTILYSDPQRLHYYDLIMLVNRWNDWGGIFWSQKSRPDLFLKIRKAYDFQSSELYFLGKMLSGTAERQRKKELNKNV